jgi:parvulin-like peptidyl-prolyl isomerase
MTKQKAAPRLTRKHLARAKRERLTSRILIVSVSAVLVIAVLVVGYGIYEQQVLLPRRPAAIINGDEISRDELGARTALAQADLLQQRRSAEQLLAFFVDNPEVQQSVQQQIAQLDAQLADTNYMAAQTLQGLIQARLIRREVERRGIIVGEADFQRAVEESFGFFADGTPTAAPSPTQDATLAAQATATATLAATRTPAGTATQPARATATQTQTPGPSATPLPTATAYARDAFEAEYQQYLTDIESSLGVGEKYIRERTIERLYQERLRESFRESVSHDEEQVWAKHILLADEATALAVLESLDQGEAWDELAASLSLDTSNKDLGGDLGWFARGAMVDEFENAAFAGAVGEIVGPVQSEFGWHLIQIVDHANRRLDGAAYEAAIDRAMSAWLTTALEQADLQFDPQLVPPTAVPTTTGTAAPGTPAISATP